MKTAHTDYNSTTNTYKKEVKREDIYGWSDLDTDLYLLDSEGERHNNLKDKFLTRESNHIVTIKPLTDEEIRESAPKSQTTSTQAYLDRVIKKRDLIFSLLRDENLLLSYKDVEVTKEFEKEDELEEQRAIIQSPEEIRKLEGRVAAYTYRKEPENSWSSTYDFISSKVEPKLKELQELATEDCPVIFGTLEDEPAMKALCNLYINKVYQNRVFLPGQLYKNYRQVDIRDFSILRVSKRNLKFVKSLPNYINIKEFMISQNKTHFEVGTYFKPLFTAEYVYEALKDLQFMKNFIDVNEEIAEAFKVLDEFQISKMRGQRSLRENLCYNTEGKQFIDTVDTATKLQLMLHKDVNPDISSIQTTYTTASVIDENILSLLDELSAYAEPVKELLNSVGSLVSTEKPLTNQQIQLIQVILASEGLDTFELSEEAINTIQNLKS